MTEVVIQKSALELAAERVLKVMSTSKLDFVAKVSRINGDDVETYTVSSIKNPKIEPMLIEYTLK